MQATATLSTAASVTASATASATASPAAVAAPNAAAAPTAPAASVASAVLDERIVRPSEPLARGRYEAPRWAFIAAIALIFVALAAYAFQRRRRYLHAKRVQLAQITNPKSYVQTSAR